MWLGLSYRREVENSGGWVFSPLGMEWVNDMPSVSTASAQGTPWPFVVQLTHEQLHKLKETVEYYDRDWDDDGISTRSAELYTVPYDRFHAMAQAFEAAYSRSDTSLSEAVASADLEGIADVDMLIVRRAEGFTLICGEQAQRLLRDTVFEASRGPGPDPVICGMQEKF